MEKESKNEKSLWVTIEQIAQLLRKEVKHREGKPIKPHVRGGSPALHNKVEQVAQLLRKQVHLVKPHKKRSRKKKT